MIQPSTLRPIIDADSIVYRCGFASDNSKDQWGNPVEEPLENCLHSVKMQVKSILSKFSEDSTYRIFLQGGGNYRDRIATIQPYKGNRDPSARPKYFDEIRSYLVDFWGAEVITGMETDDACGIEQWKHKDRSTCIVSLDKDLDNIPGWHYNYVKDEFYYVTLAQANYNFWKQVLTGDSTDYVRGIPKVGPKTADKILAGKESWVDQYVAVQQAYASKGIEHEFWENATLVWIQREEGINFDGRPIESATESNEEGNEETSEEG